MAGRCKQCGYEFGPGWIVPPDLCGDCSSAPDSLNFLPQFKPYYDTGLGVYVTSRQHRQRVMKEKGFIEVGGELKHVLGRWEPEKPGPLCTVKEVAEKLQEIQHRMANDASYREHYERTSRRPG